MVILSLANIPPDPYLAPREEGQNRLAPRIWGAKCFSCGNHLTHYRAFSIVDNLPKVLIELELQYREQRHEFLEAAFKICWVALDWSAVQLDLGFPEIAASEALNVERSGEIIVRFLSLVTDDGERQRFGSELHRVENALHLLRAALDESKPEK